MHGIKLVFVATAVGLVLAGCVGAPEASVLSGSAPRTESPEEQLVWVGSGTSWIYQEGEWRRTPTQDYQFLVRQNRFSDRWESLKVQNRTHPDYDGTAGSADQQHLFVIEYGTPQADGSIPLSLKSTYGSGGGTTDAQFERAVLEFSADGASRFAPYNHFRITQYYDYTAGTLNETVELFERAANGTETPFVRIDEEAQIFRPAPRSMAR